MFLFSIGNPIHFFNPIKRCVVRELFFLENRTSGSPVSQPHTSPLPSAVKVGVLRVTGEAWPVSREAASRGPRVSPVLSPPHCCAAGAEQPEESKMTPVRKSQVCPAEGSRRSEWRVGHVRAAAAAHSVGTRTAPTSASARCVTPGAGVTGAPPFLGASLLPFCP